MDSLNPREISHILRGSASDLIAALNAPEKVDLDLLVQHVERMLSFAIQLKAEVGAQPKRDN